MLITFCAWVAISVAGWGYCELCFDTSPSKARTFVFATEDLALRLYFGFLVLVFALLIIAFITPVSWLIGFLVLLPGIAKALSRFRQVQQQASPGTFFIAKWKYYAAALLFVALFLSSSEVQFFDTGLYHQQMAKWLSQYGLVSGLALVHARFGWTSSWFAGAAALNHGPLEGREAAILGGLPFALMAMSCLVFIRESRSLDTLPSFRGLTWMFFCGLLIAVSIVWNVASSLSPEPIIWVLPIMVALLLSEPPEMQPDNVGLAFVLSALALAVKLSAAPILGYCALMWLWKFVRVPGSRKKLLFYSGMAAAIVLLLAAANRRTSGCPFYPSPLACSSGESSVGTDFAAAIMRDTHQFAASGNRHLGLFVLVTVAAALYSLKVRWKSAFARHCAAGSSCGIVFVLITAPNPRFGLGYLLLPVAASLAILFQWVQRSLPGFLTASFKLLPALVFGAGILFAGLSVRGPDFLSSFFLPRRMPGTAGDPIHVVNRKVNIQTKLTLAEEKVDGMVVRHPESSDQCWDVALPCTPFTKIGGVELRDSDKGFREGFQLAPSNRFWSLENEGVFDPFTRRRLQP
jgi:hypothetical protein